MSSGNRFDYLLVGGGLANGLIALELLRRKPGVRIALVEQQASLGGNHTWSFHQQDIPTSLASTLEDLVAVRWQEHDVLFPGRKRRLQSSYASVFSYDLDRTLKRAFFHRPQCVLHLDSRVAELGAHHVELANGQLLEGKIVFDGRGPDRGAAHRGGFQKFVGLELHLESPAPRQRPLLMDATVTQIDGFRFVYVLPFTPTRVLIEDTYYSSSPLLNVPEVKARIFSYAKRQGYAVQNVLREESGVLPIPTRGAPPPTGEGPLAVGLRGSWFHPTTGYSFPVAARLADRIADLEPSELYGPRWYALWQEHEKRARFARWLNVLLLGAFAPRDRFHVLERFYGLPEETIARFYALESTTSDRLRIVCGRPPRGFSLTQLLAGDATA